MNEQNTVLNRDAQYKNKKLVVLDIYLCILIFHLHLHSGNL